MLTELEFDATRAAEILASVPAAPAVFLLASNNDADEPYIARTPNLRSRLHRLLMPSAKQTKRLQLASRVRRIRFHLTGSEFESRLVQLSLMESRFGAADAAKRMHLRAPVFVRFYGGNDYPRLSVTTRLTAKESAWHYGPFPSRLAAEHYIDEVLKLFLLRRCMENLTPDPAHPGCVYSEMKMCLAPCYAGCTDERYREEAAAVEAFLATHGATRLTQIATARDEASANLEFEQAAALHEQWQRVQQTASLASELVQPASTLRALLIEQAATPDSVALFLFQDGRLRGPVTFSTLGMRIQNEQSGSSSLFAQPIALMPVPESGSRATKDVLDERLNTALAQLESIQELPANPAHLSLLARWYYRPQSQREGEILFPASNHEWPAKQVLRAIGRVAAERLKQQPDATVPASPRSADETPAQN